MSSETDVIVIGGGFAGVAAARDLGTLGHEVILLEARDRLGGRTWYSSDVLGGNDLELGGTWVHWAQPHVWAEIRRYGVGLKESPTPESAIWFVDGEPRKGPYDQAWAQLDESIRRYSADALTIFDRPYEPLSNRSAVEAIDDLTIREYVQGLGLSRESEDLLLSLWGLCCSTTTADAAASLPMHWMGLVNGDPALFFDALARFKLAAGTGGLIEAMIADSRAEVVLSCPVASVDHDADRVSVTARDGRTFSAKTAIVTVPLNVLGSIEFTPALSDGKDVAALEGQASRGVKVWVRVTGLDEIVGVFGPEEAPLSYVQSELPAEGGQLLVAFGPSGDDLDPEDQDAVADALKLRLPEVEVVECAGHDWRKDEFSLGTWPVLRPGQLTRALTALQEPEGRVLFAGSETADGWTGFIDGAIESGLRAAREAKAIVGAALAVDVP